MGVQSFKTTKVPILGFSHENFKKKCHLDVALIVSYRVYYREGSGASFRRLQAV
jgi:hypothetical protein